MGLVTAYEKHLRCTLYNKAPTEILFILQHIIDSPFKRDSIIDEQIHHELNKHICKKLLKELTETGQLLSYNQLYYNTFGVNFREF